MSYDYDYLVIGSGPGGHVSAIRAAQLGLKVGVIEKDENMFGGVCLNEGCIPAKSLYQSAKIFDIATEAAELYDLKINTDCIDMAKLVKKSRKAADDLCKGLAFIFKKNKIELINGLAQFVDKNTVQVKAPEGTSTLTAERFLIATGSIPSNLPGLEFDGKHILTSSDAIRLDKVPKKLLIVGGGAIGTEFASFFSVIGTEVSIVELEDSLLPGEDKGISKRLKSIFKRKGINVGTSTSLKSAEVQSGTVKVVLEEKVGQKNEEYDAVIVCVGRSPNTSDIGLSKAGVEIDSKGFIPVDGTMHTNIDNIFAAGDIVRTPMLAHVASAEGEVAAEAAAGKAPEPIDYTSSPNAVYTKVQVASVGMTEEKAKLNGEDFLIGKQFFKANGRAVVNSETDGFIKIIAEKASGKILGAHIIGYDAAELIHEFVVAKRAGFTVRDIEKTIHAHPTFSETAIDAARSVFDKPIHG